MISVPNMTLFITGQGENNQAPKAEQIERRLNETMERICEPGSRHGTAVARYVASNKGFSQKPISLVQGIRMNSDARCNMMILYCVYLINNSMTEEEWTDCCSVCRDGLNVPNIRHIFIVQKDGLDVAKLNGAITVNDSVYLFSQETSMGNLLTESDEELDMMSYYALLAAGGKLDYSGGVYGGIFGHPALMPRQLDRVILGKLIDKVETTGPSAEKYFQLFAGDWLNIKEAKIDQENKFQIAMAKKVGDKILPDSLTFGILTGNTTQETEKRVKQFIEINFSDEKKRQFVARAASEFGKDSGKAAEWMEAARKQLMNDPSLMTQALVDYLQNTLAKWFEDKGTTWRKDAERVAGADVAGNQVAAMGRKYLMPYRMICVEFLMKAIAGKMKELAREIEQYIAARKQVYDEKLWLDAKQSDIDRAEQLIPQKLAELDRFCRDIDTALVLEDCYDRDVNRCAQKWAKKIEEQFAGFNEEAPGLIDEVNGWSATEYDEKLSRLLSVSQAGGMREFRLSPAPLQYVSAINPVSLFIGSDRLRTERLSGDTVKVNDFEVILYFGFSKIRDFVSNSEATKDILNAIRKSERMEVRQPVKHKAMVRQEEEPVDAPQEQTVETDEEMACKLGSVIRVRVPEQCQNKRLTYRFRGYMRSIRNCDLEEKETEPGNMECTEEYMDFEFKNLYGDCALTVECGEKMILENWTFRADCWRMTFGMKEVKGWFGKKKEMEVSDGDKKAAYSLMTFELSNTRGLKLDGREACVELEGWMYPIGKSDAKGCWTVWVPKDKASKMESLIDPEGKFSYSKVSV